jgi:uncharacterized protein YjeT (DUF2065 family)
MLVIEGFFYGGIPSFAKRMAAMLLQTPDETLRKAGLASALIGLGLIWLALSLIIGFSQSGHPSHLCVKFTVVRGAREALCSRAARRGRGAGLHDRHLMEELLMASFHG